MIRRLLSPLALALILILTLAPAAPAAFTTTFENAGLAPNTAVNDAGTSGQFTFDGNALNNTYGVSEGYEFWSGWSLSTMTDTTTPGFGNQYSAITGSGFGGSATYAVADAGGSPGSAYINLAAGVTPISMAITNTTYAANVIRNGNQFSRKFAAGDYFVLDIQGYGGLSGTGALLGTIPYYLADFRNGLSSILTTWDTINLSSLAGARSLRFGLRSTDNNPNPKLGINTPAYFAMDNFTFDVAPTAVPEPASLALLASGLIGVVVVGRKRTRAAR